MTLQDEIQPAPASELREDFQMARQRHAGGQLQHAAAFHPRCRSPPSSSRITITASIPQNKCDRIRRPLRSPPPNNWCCGQRGRWCSPGGVTASLQHPGLHHAWAKKGQRKVWRQSVILKPSQGHHRLVHWQNREMVGAKVFLLWFLQISRNNIIYG